MQGLIQLGDALPQGTKPQVRLSKIHLLTDFSRAGNVLHWACPMLGVSLDRNRGQKPVVMQFPLNMKTTSSSFLGYKFYRQHHNSILGSLGSVLNVVGFA